MGIVSIFLGIILLIGFVGCGFYVFNLLESIHLFQAFPKGFGNTDPCVLIVGIFTVIGLIIFLNFLMSGIAFLKINSLNKRMARTRKHKKDEE